MTVDLLRRIVASKRECVKSVIDTSSVEGGVAFRAARSRVRIELG